MRKTIKSIETAYNGYRFRSRLEARWAVFFGALGVKYEYEPEGYQTKAGRYLPDFRIKCCGLRGSADEEPFSLYVEVKGEMTKNDAEKIKEFGKEKPILIVHRIPDEGCATDSSNCESYERINGFDIFPFNYAYIDGDYFAAYPAATEDGRFYLFGDDSNYIDKEDEKRVEAAYAKARQARFEHGESPKVR